MGQADVWDYLKEHGSSTTVQIADAIDVSTSSVNSALNKLIRDKHVVREYDESEEAPLYRLADKPKKKGGRKPAITLSRDELEAAFKEAGSAKVLGERLGCNTQTVINYLDRYGIERPRYGKKRVETPSEPPEETEVKEQVEVPVEPETPAVEQEEEPEQCIPDSNIPTVCEQQVHTNEALANAVNTLAEHLASLVDAMVKHEHTNAIAEPEAPSEELLKALTNGEPVKAVEMPAATTSDVESREMPESVQDMTIPSHDDLVHLHYGLMLSIHEIGKQYHVLGSTVRKWMLYRGLPLWTEAEKEEFRKLKERVNKQGVSQETHDRAHADYVAFWDRERERYGYEPQECCRESDKAVA